MGNEINLNRRERDDRQIRSFKGTGESDSVQELREGSRGRGMGDQVNQIVRVR